MTRASVARMVLGAFAVWLSGCGTAASLLTGRPDPVAPEVYGGVRLSAKCVGQWAQYAAELDNKRDWLGGFFAAGICALLTADVPLSALADTLALPLTVGYAMEGCPQTDEGVMTPLPPPNAE